MVLSVMKAASVWIITSARIGLAYVFCVEIAVTCQAM